MNADIPNDDLGPREPGIDQLISILTSGPAPDELAGERDALAMFRAARASTAGQPTAENATVAASTAATAAAPEATAPEATAPEATASQAAGPAGPGATGPRLVPLAERFRRRAWVSGVAALAAAAALVIAAYSAALPAPVQHVAYRALGFAGVPDSGSRSPGSSPSPPGGGSGTAPAPGSRHPSGSSASGPGGSSGAVAPSPGQGRTQSPHPGQSHSPQPGGKPTPRPSGSQSPPSSSPSPSPSTPTKPPPVPAQLTINAAQVKIAAGGSDDFTGLLTDASGVPVPSRQVDLEEHTPGTPGWLPAGQATTDTTGTATFTVPDLATNAAFRLIGPSRTASGPVHVVVIPAVSLTIGPGPGPHRDILTASSPLAGPADIVILQARSGGVWHEVRQQSLAGGEATFTIKLQHQQRPYRVLLPRTLTHGQSVSNPVVAPPAP
jgi:hypothetical protein